MLLQDLYQISKYFDQPYAVFYEDDLKDKYGVQTIREAIRSGLLEHRWVPCSRKRSRRCVCWLSRKGLEAGARGNALR